jgi:hypothetical protein
MVKDFGFRIAYAIKGQIQQLPAYSTLESPHLGFRNTSASVEKSGYSNLCADPRAGQTDRPASTSTVD